jgi:ABC-2 type transport system permease protein
MTTLPAPPPTAGGTELLSYRAYRGALGGPLGGAWAIARCGLWTILRRKLFWGLYTFAVLIFLFFFFGQYLMSWVGTQIGQEPIYLNQSTRIQIKPAELLDYLQRQLKLNGTGETFRNVIWYEGYLVMTVLALAGSILVGNDFRYGSLPFYLSKPLGRWHYVLGKCLAAAVFVNVLTTLFALLLWVEFGLLDSWSYFWDTLHLVPGILGYGAVLTVLLSLLLVATASWLRKTVPMIMVWTALFVFARGIGEVLSRIGGDAVRWKLIDLWTDAYVVGNWCMGLPHDAGQPSPPEAALVLAAVVLACLTYLNRRIRAVEVV